MNKVKIILMILCLISITGCGKENNLKEVYDATYELYQQNNEALDTFSTPCHYLQQDLKACINGIEELQKSIIKVDEVMKKSSNKELWKEWKEKKKLSDKLIPDLIEYYRIEYSLKEGNENISSLSNEKINTLRYGYNSDDIKKAIGIDWDEGIYQLYASVDEKLNFSEFKDKVKKYCEEDKNVICSFEEYN